jgi:hypothetical protein
MSRFKKDQIYVLYSKHFDIIYTVEKCIPSMFPWLDGKNNPFDNSYFVDGTCKDGVYCEVEIGKDLYLGML